MIQMYLREESSDIMDVVNFLTGKSQGTSRGGIVTPRRDYEQTETPIDTRVIMNGLQDLVGYRVFMQRGGRA